jgi:hypothetical protein
MRISYMTELSLSVENKKTAFNGYRSGDPDSIPGTTKEKKISGS